jgi:hypothetical protein
MFCRLNIRLDVVYAIKLQCNVLYICILHSCTHIPAPRFTIEIHPCLPPSFFHQLIDTDTVHLKVKSMVGNNAFYSKVGGPQISSANPKICGLQFFYLRTSRKCADLRICGFAICGYIFAICGFAICRHN